MRALHISQLNGQHVLTWHGTEMALGGGTSTRTEDTPTNGVWSESPVVWEDDSIPFLQLINIDLSLMNGKKYRVLSQLEDGSELYGIYALEVSSHEEPRDAEISNLFRSRHLLELPVGSLQVKVMRQASPNAVLEVAFTVGESVVRVVSAEVYERGDGTYEICTPDETLLLQLNGVRPNHSFKRTPDGAAEVKR